MSPVPYEVIQDFGSLPPEVRAKALEVQLQDREGLTVVQTADATYAILSAGLKPSGGYHIRVQNVVEAQGKVQIHAEVVSPAPGSLSIQVITYPQAVVKLQKSDLPIEWVLA